MLGLWDPWYWAVIGIGLGLSLWASAKVKGTFARYSRIPTRSGRTGADVARAILRDNGILDVRVEPVHGSLTDHYDPRTKTLRLSEPVYGGQSMAAFGVAAHEVGHAIQHASGYAPLGFRSAWVPVASFGGSISTIVLILAFFMGGAATYFGATLSWIGIALFGATTIFTLVTVPVELDASKRALRTLESGGYTTEEELHGARKVLNAAALTYVAAFVASLLTLLYWVMRLGVLGGNRNQ